MRRIALAAGGTPGHIVPAIALAEEFASRGWDPLFLTTESGSGVEIIDSSDHRRRIVPGRAYQRQDLVGRLLAIGVIASAFLKARSILREERVDAVIGFGGYASIGPLLAARSLGIATALLEANAVPGMANRLLIPFVNRLYLGASTTCPESAVRKALRTGLPIRREVLAAATIPKAPGENKRVVVLGDTGDARFMSEKIPELINALTTPVEVVHQGSEPVGYRDSLSVHHAAFLSGKEIYDGCDLLITHAGAGTLAEIAATGTPALVIPLAAAAEDHQTRNASLFEQHGAALVVTEKARHGESLARAVDALLQDSEALALMKAGARSLASPDAARRIADDLEARLGAESP